MWSGGGHENSLISSGLSLGLLMADQGCAAGYLEKDLDDRLPWITSEQTRESRGSGSGEEADQGLTFTRKGGSGSSWVFLRRPGHIATMCSGCCVSPVLGEVPHVCESAGAAGEARQSHKHSPSF